MALGLVQRLKSSDCILESKMVELNKNKNLKSPDWSDDVGKVYLTLEINKYQIQVHSGLLWLQWLLAFYRIVVLKV